nr:RDD family protein [Brachybacterium muris]
MGSWIEGTPQDPDYVPGTSYGLPADGPGSVAGFGRRLLSLLIDWGICVAVSIAFFQYDPLATLLLFVSLNVLLLSLFGATPAQFLLGLRVLPVARRWPMPVRALVRTLAMLTVITAVVWNRDRQPLHDVLAGTAVVRA